MPRAVNACKARRWWHARPCVDAACMAAGRSPLRRPVQTLQSLERGIAVIQVFSRDSPALTLSDVARLTGMSRATARRILLTLEQLGHVRSDGRLFALTPRVLTLGWAYLASLDLGSVAQPAMEALTRQTGSRVPSPSLTSRTSSM